MTVKGLTVTKIGIRREDKNKWERRVPIIPDHLREIGEKHGIEFVVQPSDIRVFTDKEYKKAGAKTNEDLSSSDVVFAVKEIPTELFRKEGAYVFFSHVIKGQKYNMPMLKRMMELRCTLIDYEKVTDAKGRRLIFFGRHAGLAGMVDTLWALGKRLKWEGVNNPFSHIKMAYEYKTLDDAKKAVGKAGKIIASRGLPEGLSPLVTGFAGYGHVSQGAQEIYDCLPVREITPKELCHSCEGLPADRHGRNPDSGWCVYKVVFKENDMVEPVDSSGKFELQDYYDHPEKYRGVFEKYLPSLTILMNCIYWNTQYPRLVTKKFLRENYGKKGMGLKVIGDISCDVNGAIEATVKATEPGNPVFVYDVKKDFVVDGWEGEGPVIMAIDNLPCELPRESSADFSRALENFVPLIAKADYSASFEDLNLPNEIKRAVILLRGELTPGYRYLETALTA